MKTLMFLALLVACGPSAAELKTAKASTYKMKPSAMLDLAEGVAQNEYKLGDVDERNFTFITVPKFFSPEGDLESPGAGGYINMADRTVRVQFIVQVVELDGGDVAVTVTPKTFQYMTGSPQPRPLEPDDPNLPPWVHGRADKLAVDIYNQAKPYAYPATH